MNELISVIVPVYNVEEYLPKCIESIISQTYKNIEIILVDDGSTDRSGRICEEYAQKDDRIIVLHKENGGLSDARNCGINIATGDWVQFVDSDDYIHHTMLEKMYSCCRQNKTKLAVCGRVDVNAETGEETVVLCPQKEEVISSVECNRRCMIWKGSDFSACDKFYHMELWKNYRFPVGRVTEDVAVIYKIIAEADNITLLNIPMYYYFHRENSISTTQHFSRKSLHLYEHSLQILEWTQEFVPQIKNEAMSFYCKAALYTVCWLDKEQKEVRNEYHTEYHNIYNSLKANRKFFFDCEYFTVIERIKMLLIICHIYLFFYNLKSRWGRKNERRKSKEITRNGDRNS